MQVAVADHDAATSARSRDRGAVDVAPFDEPILKQKAVGEDAPIARDEFI
jgi:hypothetical protein